MKSYAQIHLQLSNLQYDEIPLQRCEKRAATICGLTGRSRQHSGGTICDHK